MADELAYLKKKLVIWSVITLLVYSTRFYLAFAWLNIVFILCALYVGLLFISYGWLALKNLK